MFLRYFLCTMLCVANLSTLAAAYAGAGDSSESIITLSLKVVRDVFTAGELKASTVRIAKPIMVGEKRYILNLRLDTSPFSLRAETFPTLKEILDILPSIIQFRRSRLGDILVVDGIPNALGQYKVRKSPKVGFMMEGGAYDHSVFSVDLKSSDRI